jgi:hypothetical protein
VLIEDTNAATVTGVNNWIQTNASPGPLSGSVQTTSPGFRNPAAKDFTLSNGSPCIRAASSVYGLPGREYFLNETTNRLWRIRAAARDLGALESTSTNGPVGPYDPSPRPLLGISRSNIQATLSWPLFAQDFQLQTAGQATPNTWSAVSTVYATNLAGLSVVAPTTTNDVSFFRLEK